MPDDKMTSEEFHTKLAKQTNNAIWPTLDKSEPSKEELEEALHMAHASTYHWSKVGKPINVARGEYMISRVNSAMGRGRSALEHAERSLKIAKSTEHKDWDIAFAYEAMTRAYIALGNKEKFNRYKDLTQKTIDELADEEDRKICQGELDKAAFQ
jgi:hypothetical protein